MMSAMSHEQGKATEHTPSAQGDFEVLYRQNAQLIRQIEHLSTLREIGLALSGTLDLNETLEIIAHVVQGALDVQRLTIYEAQQQEGRLRPIIAKYGRDLITRERLVEDSLPLYGSPLGDTLDRGKVQLEDHNEGGDALIPLIAKNEPLGVLHLENRKDGLPFAHEDAELFQQIGTQIAMAIHNAQLYAMAVTDGLTKLFVRRYFDLRMEEEFAQAQRYDRNFSLLLFDIDHFKLFNDTHGHQTGDAVLIQFAQLLESKTRNSDICCRYGGEEMTIILPETDLEEAVQLAEKLCTTIRGHKFKGVSGNTLSVSTSIGVACYHPDFDSPDQMVEAADQALYRAKEAGRDRVESATQE
mgnify:CR=1 FL=1